MARWTARTWRLLDEVGKDNIFIFGLTAEEVEKRRPHYSPWDIYHGDEEIRRALQLIERDFFSMMEPGIFRPVTRSLLEGGDYYMLLADLRDFILTQERVDSAYQDKESWDRKAIINVVCAGKFSSDRTIKQYASEIWRLEPCMITPN